MIQPKISVVTVCYNAVRDIEKTILSVINQTYPNIEYIIIDGGSKDGTMDIVNRYKDKIDAIVSEPDKGIYDAMNKGIDRATGEWINFMNADDWFNDNDSVLNVFEAVKGNYDVVYGDAKYRYTNGDREVKAVPISRLDYILPFSHQSVFVKTHIMKQRPFDTSYRLAADYDFFLELYLQERRFCYVPILVGFVRIDDGNSYRYFYMSKKEVKQSQLAHGFSRTTAVKNYYKATTWFLLKCVVKKILSKEVYNKIVTRKH